MTNGFQNLKKLAFILLFSASALSCFAADAAPATTPPAPAKDSILDIIPADCLVCVRINNLQNSLTQLDQYLTGASPVPVSLSMLATMQLAGIFGDPMMTGLNMQGDIAMAMMSTTPDNKELLMFFLVPTASTETFLKSNTNLSAADANAIYTLSAPNSPLGKMAILPLKDQNYLLVTREQNKADLLAAATALKTKKAALSSRFDASVAKAAATNPVWAYANIDALYQLFKNDIDSGIEEMQKTMAAQAAGPEAAAFQPKLKTILEMYLYFIKQSDWATLSLTPSPQMAQMEMLFSAKPNSELAGMLKPTPATGKPWQLAGYANDSAPVKFLARMNHSLIEQASNRIIDLLAQNATEAEKPQVLKWKTLMAKWFPAMGEEVAGTFAYKAGMPPFEMKEVIQIKDANAIRSMQNEMLDSLNALYASMGMNMDFTYADSVEKYKGTDIGLYQFKFTVGDPNDPNNPAANAMQAMYGKQGLQYPIAITPDRFIITMGPDAMNQIKALIDSNAPGAAAGDIKTALDTIPNSAKADMIMSINIPHLMKGVSDMTSQSMAHSGHEMPNFWEGIAVNTTSAMAISSVVENGRVRGTLILPKQHLAETIQVFMQVQQKTMAYYMQQSQKQTNGPGDMNSLMLEPESPILKHIGKPASELKLKDTAGNEIVLSKLKGKPIIIDFWATWCPPCREMVPHIISLRKQYKDSELAIIGVSNEPPHKLQPFIEKSGINYQIVSYQDELPAPYDEVTGLPTMIFIDAEGVIRDVKIGSHGAEEIKHSLDKIIKKTGAV
jgi:thiol-disulfide isomerase/thioredoxin